VTSAWQDGFIFEPVDEYGQDWWDRYGEQSMIAALVVSGFVLRADAEQRVAALRTDTDTGDAQE
jgi:hypothetical protein